MKPNRNTVKAGRSCLIFALSACILCASLGDNLAQDIPPLDNPMTVEYLHKNLRDSLPRLVLTDVVENRLRRQLESDPVIRNMVQAIRLNAEQVFEEELLSRQMVGRRLLGTSREMLWRINVLGLMYRLERQPRVLQRINDELLAVCAFEDWNPSHFLDVGEMSLAVALALDWTAGDLPESTIRTAQTALMEKGIRPGENKRHFYAENNWNQVCNGGLVAAAIAVAEVDPELAARTIHRALDGLPVALVQYGPDGVHPEAASYWEYASGYTAITASILESAFGTDFGIAKYPGLQESALYRVLMCTPTGGWYNYGDCADGRSENGDLTLAWFAEKSGDATFFEKQRFLRPAEEMGKLSRWAGIALVWLSKFRERQETNLPTAWAGDGVNPVIVFRDSPDNARGFYLGAKGGCGSINHGNMDGGSFILELDGVRWAVEIGKENYHDIEKAGLNLWDSSQDGDRWKLLSKNNFGHSTLTVNGELHRVNGNARLLYFNDGQKPEAAFDLTPAFGDLVSQATRAFVKDSPGSVRIHDTIVLSDVTELVTWQMLTTADVRAVPGGARLSQDGKQLRLEIVSHPDSEVAIVALDPPPMELDRRIKGLKRIEIRVPRDDVAGQTLKLSVRLAGEQKE